MRRARGNKQSCHQPPFRSGDFCPTHRKGQIGVYAPTGGIYPATILLLCNGVAMARTTAERQAAYRKNRATAGDNGERRINVWVSTATALALQRLARRDAVTQRSVIEELVLAADEQAAAGLTEEEWAEYFSVTR